MRSRTWLGSILMTVLIGLAAAPHLRRTNNHPYLECRWVGGWLVHDRRRLADLIHSVHNDIGHQGHSRRGTVNPALVNKNEAETGVGPSLHEFRSF